MEKDIEKTIKNLEKKKYKVSFFETSQEAVDYLEKQIVNKFVGFGDSESMLQMNLYDILCKNNEVVDPMHCQEGEDFWSTARKCLLTDVYLTSVNAMAETGEMVNIDGTGNRVAGSLFGHEKVYFVVGTNKIEKTLEDARFRARNMAAPMNASRHGFKTPCSINEDKCYDCESDDRICCGEMIYLHKMRFIEMEIILINEELGY